MASFYIAFFMWSWIPIVVAFVWLLFLFAADVALGALEETAAPTS